MVRIWNWAVGCCRNHGIGLCALFANILSKWTFCSTSTVKEELPVQNIVQDDHVQSSSSKKDVGNISGPRTCWIKYGYRRSLLLFMRIETDSRQHPPRTCGVHAVYKAWANVLSHSSTYAFMEGSACTRAEWQRRHRATKKKIVVNKDSFVNTPPTLCASPRIMLPKYPHSVGWRFWHSLRRSCCSSCKLHLDRHS